MNLWDDDDPQNIFFSLHTYTQDVSSHERKKRDEEPDTRTKDSVQKFNAMGTVYGFGFKMRYWNKYIYLSSIHGKKDKMMECCLMKISLVG